MSMKTKNRSDAESEEGMSRVCDAGAFCLQKPQCEHRCYLTGAELKGEARFENTVITQPHLVRELKPWPVVPDDIEPETETLHTMGSILLGLAMAVLLVFFLLMLFTGMWIWSLLI